MFKPMCSDAVVILSSNATDKINNLLLYSLKINIYFSNSGYLVLATTYTNFHALVHVDQSITEKNAELTISLTWKSQEFSPYLHIH